MKKILMVIVVYKVRIEECPTYRSLIAGLSQLQELTNELQLLICDNSPEPQTISQLLPHQYIHDGKNPGLAFRYNYALEQARSNGIPWLLLLDQDTTLTSEYLTEIHHLSGSLTSLPAVIAAVPQLISHGTHYSPHLPPFSSPSARDGLRTSGVHDERICPYNSGALIAVSALESIGGFPEAYWLDQLDLATFHRLQSHGGKVFVMNSIMEHELSVADEDKPADPARHRSQLEATARYYREYGTLRQSILHRIGLCRASVGSFRRGLYPQALRNLGSALSLGPR